MITMGTDLGLGMVILTMMRKILLALWIMLICLKWSVGLRGHWRGLMFLLLGVGRLLVVVAAVVGVRLRVLELEEREGEKR